MVANPPTRLLSNGHSSGYTLTTVTSERKGERFQSLVRPTTKAVKDKPHRNVRKNNFTACGRRAAARVLHGEIKVAIPETLCKTWIVFSDEHSAMHVPNRATAVETRSPYFKRS